MANAGQAESSPGTRSWYRRPTPLLRSATAFGLAVWGTGCIEMTAMQLAPPPWQDPPASLAVDVGFHLVYGLGAALAFRVLNRTTFS